MPCHPIKLVLNHLILLVNYCSINQYHFLLMEYTKLLKTFLRNPYILPALLLSFSLPVFSQDVDNLKLKDFRPVSIYKVPVSKIEKAKFPVIDFHSHDDQKTTADIDKWVQTMND